jgi:hypothetical protein
MAARSAIRFLMLVMVILLFFFSGVTWVWLWKLATSEEKKGRRSMRAYSIFHPVDGMAEYLYIVLKWQSTPELSSSFAAIHFCTRVPGSLTPNIGQTQATPLPECPSSLRQSLGTAMRLLWNLILFSPHVAVELPIL